MPKPKLEDVPETCQSCRFFHLDDPKEVAGFCRRFPPVFVGSEDEGGWTFAVTTEGDWCGEFKANQ